MNAMTLDMIKAFRAALRADPIAWATAVRAIQELHDAGFLYREIDEILVLPYKSYRMINGRRAKFILATEGQIAA